MIFLKNPQEISVTKKNQHSLAHLGGINEISEISGKSDLKNKISLSEF